MARKRRPQSWSKFAVLGYAALYRYRVSTLVVLLLAVVLIRYNSKRNPEPSSVTHNNILEVIWIAIPVIILFLLLPLPCAFLYGQIQLPDGKSKIADKAVPAVTLTVKATGSQWYWIYSYLDDGIEFDSIMLADDELKAGQTRLLAVDNELIVPVNATVRVLVTTHGDRA